jgi:hypothetical protein
MVPEPCEAITVGAGECPVMSVAAAVCVHEALRDRRPGAYSAGTTTCTAIGSSSSGTLFVVRPDGRASQVSSSTGGFDSSSVTYGAAYDCALADQSYFDACLELLMPSDGGAPPIVPDQNCMLLRGAFTDCVEAPARCE